MSTTAQVPVPASIWNWVTTIGTTRKLTAEDHRRIERWSAGDSAPTINQLSNLSSKLEIPFGYFFLTKPIDDTPAMFAHRTIRNASIDRPSQNLIDTLDDMQAVQDWMRQDAIDRGDTPLPFVGSQHTDHADIMSLATAIRKQLGMPTAWYSSNGRCLPVDEAFTCLREYCAGAGAGIIVMLNGIVRDNTHRTLDPQEFRAFALIDEYAPLIFINRADSRHGQIFSLAHEIVHVWLGEEEIYNDEYRHANNAPVEVLCNAVAAELIMPQQEFILEWKHAEGDTTNAIMNELTQSFPVSPVVIARRALDGHLISQDAYDRIIAENARQWEERTASSSGGNYYSTKRSRLDHRFVEHLAASLSEGRTSYTDAYRLTGTNRKTFSKLLDTMGVR